MDADRLIRTLLPRPRKIRMDDASCPITTSCQLDVRVEDQRIHRAAQSLVASAESQAHSRSTSTSPSRPVRWQITVDPRTVAHRQGYRLIVAPGHIDLIGGSPAGCFYGLQTLGQIVDATREERSLPCCTIEDEPDFETRGLLHDVTRGKVPTLETLKHLADRLATWKINQFQIYIEHAFVFSFDPDICDELHGLTPDEIRELDAYCHERFIDLVPAVATFGHMGRILSLPRYRQLAEIEANEPWERMTWPQRARGLTLDCMNPESHRLVEHVWRDILDAFSSPVVNICGDEPWDLGRGKNSERLGDNHGGAYLEHIRRTHDCCVSQGRSTQFWSDVLRNYPALFHQVPRDATVLHWGYDDQTDYAATRSLVEAGMTVHVCPGTRGWKRIMNALDAAERNIQTFAQAGKQFGATGLINTDWGDHGHFQMLACSWHPIALGAALGWSASHPTGHDFDARCARQVLGTDDERILRSLRAASRSADTVETWKLLWMSSHAIPEAELPLAEWLGESAGYAREAACPLRKLLSETSDQHKTNIEELILACEFLELLPRVVSMHSARTSGLPRKAGDSADDGSADVLDGLINEYADLWRARNKPSGLNDILNVLARIGRESGRAVAS